MVLLSLSLYLAHGNLRPENVLLNYDCLKLTDFDYTVEIRSKFEACILQYGGILGSEAGLNYGKVRLLSPQTEQFAFGSLFNPINYGFKVHGNQRFGNKPLEKVRRSMVIESLRNMVFPELNGEPVIDSIIKKFLAEFSCMKLGLGFREG